jgi:hypothetical protein
MTRSRPGTLAASRPCGRSRRALERRAGEFLEFSSLAVLSSDDQVREHLQAILVQVIAKLEKET